MTKKRRDPQAQKTGILLAALPDAAFDGWNDDLLKNAARRLRLQEDDLRDVFPGGAFDLACYFSAWADGEALKKLPAEKLAAMKVREKITLGVRTRLEILEPHRQAVSAALGYLSLPPRNLALPKMVWATADALWRAAGDASTDYNYYTKRLLLSGVLTSTTLYWLNDKSKDNGNTWKFLDRRIENVLQVGQKISSLRKRAQERHART